MKKVLICEVCQKYKAVRSEKEFIEEIVKHQNKYHLKLFLTDTKKAQLDLFSATDKK